jgi:hypothetical protein
MLAARAVNTIIRQRWRYGLQIVFGFHPMYG